MNNHVANGDGANNRYCEFQFVFFNTFVFQFHVNIINYYM